jgi:hypothetical protein
MSTPSPYLRHNAYDEPNGILVGGPTLTARLFNVRTGNPFDEHFYGHDQQQLELVARQLIAQARAEWQGDSQLWEHLYGAGFELRIWY